MDYHPVRVAQVAMAQVVVGQAVFLTLTGENFDQLLMGVRVGFVHQAGKGGLHEAGAREEDGRPLRSIASPLENSNRKWNTALWERTPNRASFRAAVGATAAGFNTRLTCMARVPPSLLSPTPGGIAIATSTSSPTTPCWRPSA